MIEAAAYSVHIRCDTDHRSIARATGSGKHFDLAEQWTYVDNSLAGCKRQAINAGWRFLRDGRTFCPACKPVKA